ncbi:MAG: OTU domain-containing protein [Opitutales bacterium]
MKKLILLFIFKIFVACYMGLACKQPVQLPFECLSDLQKKVHYFLCRQATQVYHSRLKNYFTAALVFYFKDNVQPLVLWISSGQEKEDDITTNGCFISGRIGTNATKAFKSLHNTLNEGFNESWTSLNTYISRSIQNVKKHQKVFTKFRLTDSEMQFLHTITNQRNTEEQLAYSHAIIQSIQNYPNLQLHHIELHGFTTRDMCPCCFQHLQNFLIQANTQQTNPTTFFGSLLTQLNKSNIPVSFFISSLVELGHNEYACSRYPSYHNACKEKIAIASAPSEKTMHCIFLRPNSAPLLSLKGKETQQKQKMVISTANTIFSETKKIQQENPKPGVEQMQLGNFKLKKDSECKTRIIVIDLRDINLGTQPVSQTPETLTIAGQQFRLHDVPKDGNCGFWSILVAKGEISQEELDKLMSVWEKIKRGKRYYPNWSECSENFLNEEPEIVEKMVNLRADCELNNLGIWMGNDNLQQISGVIQRPIILVQRIKRSLAYTLYDENNDGIILKVQNIKYHNNAIFIYYADNHFQAIVPER